MNIMGLGIDYSTGDLLVHPMSDEEFASRVKDALDRNAEELRQQTRIVTHGATFKREIEMGPAIDIRDPRAAGWTFLLNADDPRREDLIEVIRPLAEHRGMTDPSKPLLYDADQDWFDWLLENYTALDMQRLPHYLLVVGGPDQVPFHFQALLDSTVSTGRLAFDSLDDLKAYVEKVLRLERAADPTTGKRALFFAPDYGTLPDGSRDPTYYSRQYMAQPLSRFTRDSLGFEVASMLGGDATKEHLVAALTRENPALVYTASHGMEAPDEPLDVQHRVNGAICCQRTGAEHGPTDYLFMGEDVLSNQPFLEGAAFFQFACFGLGTPAESDFMHWLGNPELNSSEDFVAALPKRLLAHPRGPVAFIGHVDTAWLHGFDDPDSPDIIEAWNVRIGPFVQALGHLLRVEPVGRALTEMSDRYTATNAILTGTWDRLQRRKIKTDSQFWSRLSSTFVTRSDAQNYMLFGDPGARLRIAD